MLIYLKLNCFNFILLVSSSLKRIPHETTLVAAGLAEYSSWNLTLLEWPVLLQWRLYVFLFLPRASAFQTAVVWCEVIGFELVRLVIGLVGLKRGMFGVGSSSGWWQFIVTLKTLS